MLLQMHSSQLNLQLVQLLAYCYDLHRRSLGVVIRLCVIRSQRLTGGFFYRLGLIVIGSEKPVHMSIE
jgi:hypothetical protein